MWVQSLGQEDPVEDGMTTHSSILAWRIPMDPGQGSASTSPESYFWAGAKGQVCSQEGGPVWNPPKPVQGAAARCGSLPG